MGRQEAGRHVRVDRIRSIQKARHVPGTVLRLPFLLTVNLTSSDADSDVLADYVLALVRADTPESELRLNVIENLEDFLRPSRLLCYTLKGFLSSNEMLI